MSRKVQKETEAVWFPVHTVSLVFVPLLWPVGSITSTSCHPTPSAMDSFSKSVDAAQVLVYELSEDL